MNQKLSPDLANVATAPNQTNQIERLPRNNEDNAALSFFLTKGCGQQTKWKKASASKKQHTFVISIPHNAVYQQSTVAKASKINEVNQVTISNIVSVPQEKYQKRQQINRKNEKIEVHSFFVSA